MQQLFDANKQMQQFTLHSLEEIMLNPSEILGDQLETLVSFKPKESEQELLLHFKHQNFIFNSQPCQILTIRDMTSFYKFDDLKNQHDMAKSINVTVSHEMMTPLNCIISFADNLTSALENPEQKNKANLISKTA